MKKLISRRNFLAAMGTVAAAGVLTACGGSSSGTASSAAASSTAASAAESWGDVKLTMWGAEDHVGRRRGSDHAARDGRCFHRAECR